MQRADANPVAGGVTNGLEPVAIIGMACIFPQAPDLAAFWRNIVTGVDAVGEPQPAWDAQRYVGSGRVKTACGGYLRDLYRFDPREFGIMPASLDGGEPDQFLALRVARDALQDAGYLRADYDHSDSGIVLGHSTYLHRGQGTLIQNHIVVDQTLELLSAALPGLQESQLGQLRDFLQSRLPAASADIAPGLVPNVMTGRIANRLNFRGPNYLVDAACSSSLLAVSAAMDELRAGRSRLMLAGGVNASLPPEVAVIFTQLGALSGRGRVRPFEAGSDGTLLGEGLGIVALKRLSDAIADDDRIYAVIRAVGQASDGRGLGLLAPNVEGETLAIRRAYLASGVDPASIGLIEAHGTGIPLGDRTEISALRNVFGDRTGPMPTIALGSVKSMISHCIPAAGVAGLIKTTLALHHKVLPPTLCETVNPELGIDTTPLYVNTRPAPWVWRSGVPRRAGIDSFGFGGINTHAIIEEAPIEARRPPQLSPWSAELCIVSATTAEEVQVEALRLASVIRANPHWPLDGIAAALAARDRRGPCRLALVSRSRDELVTQLEQAAQRTGDGNRSWATRGGAVYGEDLSTGKLAFLFPGEGSQYVGMLADLAMCFDEVRAWFDFWRSLYDEAPGATRTDLVFPPGGAPGKSPPADIEQPLNRMDVGSEAVFIGGQAMGALLHRLGVEPDVMMGHSSGESTALAASGAVDAADTMQLAAFIRRLNAIYREVLAAGRIPTGALLAVGAVPSDVIAEHVAKFAGSVFVAMDNCPSQEVLYGSVASIALIHKSLGEAGAILMPLAFDRGYHTPAFAAMSDAFRDFYAEIALRAPAQPLYSCASAGLFPQDADAVRDLASAQWSTRVRFRETLLRMHEDGVRIFVEVGPSGNLTAFAKEVLGGREHLALATNLRRRPGLDQFLTVLAHLYACGRPFRPEQLFANRHTAPVDLAGTAPAPALGVLLDNTLPVIRIGDAERAMLRQMLAVRTGDAAPVATPAETEAELPAETATGPVGDDAGFPVVAAYFELMRDFLGCQQAVLEYQQPVAARAGIAAAARELPPFIESVTEVDELHVRATCRLDAGADNFLRDHVLSGAVSTDDAGLQGLSCVPLAVSLEIMAEACATLAGSYAVRAIENIKAHDWIALDTSELELEVHAELLAGERGVYRARLMSAGGIAVSADYHFDPELHLPGLADLRECRAARWNDGELYTCGMFHGPLFQSIHHIDGWDDSGIDATLADCTLDGFFRAGDTPGLVLNPVLLDAAGQLAAYWIAEQVGTDFNCFPSGIGRIELYEPCPAGGSGLTLRARQHSLDGSIGDQTAPRAWQFDCVDAQGHPVFRIANLVNVYFAVPHRFYEVRRDPLRGELGEAVAAPAQPGVVLWTLPLLAEEFCTQSAAVFLRILAQVYLSADERDTWQGLAHARRRRQWLLGRACIKEAVRHWILRHTGQLLYPADIVVTTDELGGPRVGGRWCGQLAEAPEVSLSHNERACLAAVAAPRSPVGVDIEEIGRLHRPQLIIEALSPSEQSRLDGLYPEALEDRLVRIWCAKEAAAKLLGVGLQGQPSAFEVSFADERCEVAWVDHAETRVMVAVSREGNSILALASGHRSHASLQ